MDIKLHKTATTTPRIRREIQQAPASISDSELARRYRVSCPTIARWRYRETQHDLSHTRHNLLKTLSPAQCLLRVVLRAAQGQVIELAEVRIAAFRTKGCTSPPVSG